jgi:hypothetical protein
MGNETEVLERASDDDQDTASGTEAQEPKTGPWLQFLGENINDPALQMDHDHLQAREEASFEVIASIRDNVRNLPQARHAELFADFADAAGRKDIDYMADTVLNWATGGNGYEYAGLPVNRLARRMAGKYKNDPTWPAVEKIMAEAREKLSE